MRISHLPFIKICCITSMDEANRAISAGASALGLVSSMPSGPGVIDDLLIARIVASVPPPVATFLLTAHRDAASIINQHRLCQTSTIQLVDSVELSELQKLRSNLTGIKIVQVIHVTDDSCVEKALAVSSLVDAILLDSGNQNLLVKELGGTGRTHDWDLSRRIRDEVNSPVFLAGGLNESNIATAIRAVQPFGLDLCSSVRTGDRLDDQKLATFFEAVKQAE
ncbi:MAG: phosphoribosylanthranilate isomerase [bacterium]|nr:phosphoribosylanthranilate isomerase [Gammaproteobacteria bacterium]HIL98132.1 phosphoribosylanthranilate isomerase [Pseudomonadales bacterium]